MTEILNKALIEVCKFQETFYLFYLGRNFSISDCLNYVVFHLDFFFSNYYFQYRYFLDIEVAL